MGMGRDFRAAENGLDASISHLERHGGSDGEWSNVGVADRGYRRKRSKSGPRPINAFERLGLRTVCGSCASEIARTLGRRVIQIKAIIADFELDDGLTGLRNAESLRLAIGRKVPTIVTTGHRRQAEREDKFAVLEKPFDPSVLHDWLISQVGFRLGKEEESSAHQ
jgi:CheY-like chemotaxis protein